MPTRWLTSTRWLHALVWITLLAGLAIVWHDPAPADPGGLPGGYFILTNLFHIGLFYGVAYGLFPRFFRPDRWWLYLLSVVLLLGAVYAAKVALINRFFPAVVWDDFTRRIVFFPTLFFIVVGTLYRLIADHFARQREQKARQAEQLGTELKLLRSQVNPHFLFNVLNSLVALARKKSDRLEPALVELSGLMRYMLYDSESRQVPLHQEIEYITNYVALQRLRFGDELPIELDLPRPEVGYLIEPMLLIPFVENAFKHGTGWIAQPFIRIQLRVEQRRLQFTVTNAFNSADTARDPGSGIGLGNVRSRLNLLYPGAHRLDVVAEGSIFRIDLTLQFP